jgi:hypothetical protein
MRNFDEEAETVPPHRSERGGDLDGPSDLERRVLETDALVCQTVGYLARGCPSHLLAATAR